MLVLPLLVVVVGVGGVGVRSCCSVVVRGGGGVACASYAERSFIYHDDTHFCVCVCRALVFFFLNPNRTITFSE